MTLSTKPRWDKYDGYVGNFRGVLANDINLNTQSNVVLAVGVNSSGAVVIGSGQTGIKGLMIVPVASDGYGNLLDGGINTKAGDTCDVGKHGEITNFKPSVIANTFVITVVTGSGNFTVKVKNTVTGVSQPTAGIAFNAIASAVKTGIAGVDDSLLSTDSTLAVAGTAPTFTVTLPWGYAIEANDATATVATPVLTAAAGTNYYAHADGSVNATKGGDGIYVGHTAEADRLIVNVLDATP